MMSAPSDSDSGRRSAGRRSRLAPGTWMLVLLGLGGLTGCSTPERLGSNAQKPYQWESLSHHPQLAWHRHRADSATLFVRLPAHELLHLREGLDAPFRYSIEVELIVDPLEWPETGTGEAPPTLLHRFRWEGMPDPEADDLIARFSFPLATGRFRIVHTVRDLHRGADVTGSTLMDGWSPDAPARTLAFDPTTGAPAWDHVLPSGRRMGLLVPADLATGFWEHGHLAPVDSFPSAPFLDRSVAELLFPEETDRQLPLTPTDGDDLRLPEGNWDDWRVLTWAGGPGIHRWAPPGGPRPVLVSGRRPHFPVMRDLDEMIRATRYIAKRDEYQTMRTARDPKRALDEFWLQFGEDPEEARQLIATYYGRVREANVHFSGLKEGWCTDRGMVHIIFGHADRVRRDRIGETWIYGDEGDVNALVFRFSRRERGDDFNAFDLERYPGFRSPWEAMVGSWRRGKVRKR